MRVSDDAATCGWAKTANLEFPGLGPCPPAAAALAPVAQVLISFGRCSGIQLIFLAMLTDLGRKMIHDIGSRMGAKLIE